MKAVYIRNEKDVQQGDTLEDAFGFICSFVGLPPKINPLHSCRIIVRTAQGADKYCIPCTYGVKIVEE